MARPECRFRSGVLLISLICGLQGISLFAQGQDSLVALYAPRLEKVLKENIAAFWYPKCLDTRNGGYIISYGPRGEFKGDGPKMIVTQARMVWLFSRLARAGYEPQTYLKAAEHGYRFLRERMWDDANGGFYWEVDSTGGRKLMPLKHLYGQSFALYAVSEYYLASRKQEALDFAIRFFQLLDSKAHDDRYGGYLEFFREDWTPAPAGTSNYMGIDIPDVKLMNTHLHLLEAMTTFYRASQLPQARQRLLELITIQSNAVVRKKLGACTDGYDPDWTPRLEGDGARVSYGHDLENIWLLADACDAVGQSIYPYIDLFKTLFDYSLEFGYDFERGGFYYFGPFDKPAENRDKSFWVQAEAIVSALALYQLTRDPKYRRVFEETYGFIEKYQVDWENGEWHETIAPNGLPKGDKGHIWKAGYHNGRAMIECLSRLRLN